MTLSEDTGVLVLKRSKCTNNKNKLLKKFWPFFKRFAQLGSILPRLWFILPTFKFGAGKGVFWGGVGGVLCTYISEKGVCDGWVKDRSYWWYVYVKTGNKHSWSISNICMHFIINKIFQNISLLTWRLEDHKPKDQCWICCWFSGVGPGVWPLHQQNTNAIQRVPTDQHAKVLVLWWHSALQWLHFLIQTKCCDLIDLVQSTGSNANSLQG